MTLILEGTWEEIRAHESELAGQWLRVIATPNDERAQDDGPVAETPLSDLLEGLIGVIDSSKEPRPDRPRSAYGEALAAKFAKQGLRT